MATSGSKSITVTSWDTLKFSWWENSQSIEKNTTTIGWKMELVAGSSGYIGSTASKDWSVTVNGTKYSGTNTVGISANTTKTLASGTTTISHNADGTKTFSYSFSQEFAITFSGSNIGTKSGSGSGTLDTIPRKSTLSVGNGTLNTAQTLNVTRQANSFTHSIKAVCGTSTLYIKADGSTSTTEVKHSGLSISFTPPLSWASQNTSGTSVTIKYTITTYNGNTSIGHNSYSKTCSIPSSVKPTISFSVSDEMEYLEKYGAYVQSKSKFKIIITATESYGSAIKKYNTTVDGKTYTSESFTTDVISGTDSMTINVTVTDARGRTASASKTVTVLEYSPPKISSQKATRCDSNGIKSSSGDYLTVTFNAEITALNSKNLASYAISYKKTRDNTYTDETLSTLSGQYSVSGGVFIFEADKSSSYDITITATDDFASVNAKFTGSSIKKLWSWLTKGIGIAFGKIAEFENTVEFAMDAKFNNPVYGKALGMDKLPSIPSGSDLNDYITTGCFAVYSNATAESCSNIPVERAGRLEVWSATGEGVRPEQWSYLRQRFIPYNSSNAVWEREITRGENNVWTFYEWYRSSLDFELSDRIYNKSAITIGLSANSTMSVKQTYTKIPFNTNILSLGSKLTLSSNSVLIGSNISHVKISAQIQIKSGTVAGIRHFRIQKTSNGTTSWAWSSLNSSASANESYNINPIIVPVTEGDLLSVVYYTSDTEDYVVAGSSANGRQSYLTVEEF